MILAETGEIRRVRGRQGRGRGELPLLMAAHFTNDIYSNFLPAYIPQLIAKFSLSLALAGAASSIYTTISSFAQLFFGYAGDRLFGLRLRLAFIAPLITVVFMSAVGAMPSYPLVLGLLCLASLGTASFHPPGAALAGRASREHKGLSVSIFIAAGSLGYALGPPLATGFIALAGFERSYLLALPALALAALLLKESRPRLKAGLPNLREGREEREGRPDRSGLPSRALLPLLPLTLTVTLRHTVQLVFITFLIVLLEERGLSRLAGSLILALSLIAGTAGTILGGHLSDRFGRRPVAALTLALAFPLYFGFLHTTGAVSFSFLALGWVLAAASNPVIVTQAQELTPGHAGMASAFTMGFGWGIAGLLVSLVGWLADTFGLTRSLNWTILALPIAAAISLISREGLSPDPE